VRGNRTPVEAETVPHPGRWKTRPNFGIPLRT